MGDIILIFIILSIYVFLYLIYEQIKPIKHYIDDFNIINDY